MKVKELVKRLKEIDQEWEVMKSEEIVIKYWNSYLLLNPIRNDNP